MSSSNFGLTIYWLNGKITEISLPDPIVKDPNAVSTEIDLMLDDLTDGLHINISNHFLGSPEEEPTPETRQLGPLATWKPLCHMRLFSATDLKDVDFIMFQGQTVIANLDGTIYSLMKLNRLAEMYLDSASALSSYNLINDVASCLEAELDVCFDEEGLVTLSEIMGLESSVLKRARAIAVNQGELDAGETLSAPSPDASSVLSSLTTGTDELADTTQPDQTQPLQPHVPHISFDDVEEDGDDAYI